MPVAVEQPHQTVVFASAAPFVRRRLVAQRGPVTVLGRFPTALYVELESGAVIAVLTSDAVSLPIGIDLPTSSGDMPLDRRDLGVQVHDGMLSLGDLTIVAAQDRSCQAELVGTPRPERVAASLRVLTSLSTRGALPFEEIADLARPRSLGEARSSVRSFLGRGPGLTPLGDDVLCGLLAGGVLFGRRLGDMRVAVLTELADRPRATTSLSRQLLERACAGDVIPEVAAFGRALCLGAPRELDAALRRLLTIGASSGTALAYGVVAACDLP